MNESKDAYTVLVASRERSCFEGRFRSYGAAEIYARDRVTRSRSPVVVQVHYGTPERPMRGIGPVFRS